MGPNTLFDLSKDPAPVPFFLREPTLQSAFLKVFQAPF